MATKLEQTVMSEIGLGQNYRWFNGSGSCGYIRQNAVDKLAEVAKKHGLAISSRWISYCRTANQMDQMSGGEYKLTNTWIACSYAIQDAIYRSEGSEGFSPNILINSSFGKIK